MANHILCHDRYSLLLFKQNSYIFLFVNIIIIVIVSSNKGVMYLCRFVGVSVCLSV